jgi:beta-lactamase superfamily II metal-dependent hydrolase
MGWEIDVLHLGDSKKSADAIALRFGNLFGTRSEQFVAVVDAGFKTNGEAMVNHIKNWYNTDMVDLAVSTHPDTDHAAGLSVVLEELKVKELWLHQPWKHTDEISKFFEDGRVASIRQSLRESLENAMALEQLAIKKGIPITEPFAGLADPTKHIFVVGPTKQYYESLLPEFKGLPEPKEDAVAALYKSLLEYAEAVKETVNKVFETWGFETLNDDGETTAENNSSAILIVKLDETKHVLLTGDAGMPALTSAVDWLDKVSYSIPAKLYLAQVPHHGSDRNIGPTVLNRILGPKLPKEQESLRKYLSFVSVCKGEEPKHPSKKVMNAFRRRGAHVHSNVDLALCCNDGAPIRNWGPATPLPFYNEVEE